jgi:3-hydroxypropanoate dehydrogenase
MSGRIAPQALEQLFLNARTQNKWQAKDVTDAQLREIIDIMKMGPTSANCQPARFIFLRTPTAKARLKPFLSANNQEKTMAAPVTVIIGNDFAFYEHLPRTFPHADAKSWFTGNAELAGMTAIRNGTLQGAYLMIAARAIGIDVGAMSGFDAPGVDKEFFADTTVKVNFICNLGYGDPAGVMGRLPRFEFDEIAKIV